VQPSVLPVKLREGRDGLVTNAWINGAGPFVFAIDTGAGVSLINRNVVERARLQVTRSSRPLVGGLSTARIASNEEARLSDLALGQPNNHLNTRAEAAVVTTLPGSIDGILDPTDVFSPLGYSVDLPNHELRVFEGRLRANDNPPGGAVVRWVGKDRPFVRFSDGRLALIDTGSGFGLALTDGRVIGGRNHGDVENRNDLGGGHVKSQSIVPQRVSIGNLVLNGVPSDVLTGAAPGTPNILGRRALFPFKITFDPVSRLISFEPAER
jgi:hypothetical protein